MDNLNDIRAVWRSARVDNLPDVQEIKAVIHRYRRRRMWRRAGLVAAAVLVSCLLCLHLFRYTGPSVLDRLPDILALALWGFLLVQNGRSFRRAYRMRDYNNKDFLAYLDRSQAANIRYYKSTLLIALAVGSVGQLLLVYNEFHQSLVPCLIAYVVTVAFLLYIWLVFRPRQFRKKMRRFETLRARMEKISGQL